MNTMQDFHTTTIICVYLNLNFSESGLLQQHFALIDLIILFFLQTLPMSMVKRNMVMMHTVPTASSDNLFFLDSAHDHGEEGHGHDAFSSHGHHQHQGQQSSVVVIGHDHPNSRQFISDHDPNIIANIGHKVIDYNSSQTFVM